MSLNTEIADIVNALKPDGTFILSSWFKANRNSYNLAEMTVEKPYVTLDNEQQIEAEIQLNANLLERTNLRLWFFVKSGVYKSDTEMQAELDAIRPFIDQVMGNIYRLDDIRIKAGQLATYRKTPKFKVFNSVLVGWEVTANWYYNTVANWCPNPPTT